jgi:hypothetical protein
MEIPKYLKDALYKFSEDVIAERDHFDELQKQAEEEEIELEKHKDNWLTHLFRESKPK